MDDQAKADKSDVKFPLDFPLSGEVTCNGAAYTSLHFRMPKGRDWTRWSNVPEGPARTHGLLADLAGVPAEVFQELPFLDHAKAVEIAEGFFVQYRLGENGLVKQLLTSPGALAGLMQIAATSGSTSSSGSESSGMNAGTAPGAPS